MSRLILNDSIILQFVKVALRTIRQLMSAAQKERDSIAFAHLDMIESGIETGIIGVQDIKFGKYNMNIRRSGFMRTILSINYQIAKFVMPESEIDLEHTFSDEFYRLDASPLLCFVDVERIYKEIRQYPAQNKTVPLLNKIVRRNHKYIDSFHVESGKKSLDYVTDEMAPEDRIIYFVAGFLNTKTGILKLVRSKPLWEPKLLIHGICKLIT